MDLGLIIIINKDIKEELAVFPCAHTHAKKKKKKRMRKKRRWKNRIYLNLIILTLIGGLIFDLFGLLIVFFHSSKTHDSEFWWMSVGTREYGMGSRPNFCMVKYKLTLLT